MISWRLAHGWAATRQLLRHETSRALLSEQLIAPLVRSAWAAPQTKQAVLLVGYSGAGKSTFRRTHPELATLACVETDAIHRQLNELFPMLRDDTTIRGRAFWMRQFLTSWVRGQVYPQLIGQGTSFVVDACNLDRGTRLAITRPARQANYQTTIIWVQPDSLTHYERLRAADDRREAEGLPRTMYNLVERVQRLRFEPPFADEADRIITHFGRAPIPTLGLC